MARDYALWQKSLAEGIGSAFLLMAIVGAGQLSTNLAEGAAVVPALHLLAISAAAGLCLKVFITTLGPISGGHFNGAVTAVMFAQGELVWQEAAAYCAAQLAGAFLGVWSVHAMFELPVMQVSTASTPAAHAWLAEAIATFGLLLVILLGEKLQPDSVPGNVGCFIAATLVHVLWVLRQPHRGHCAGCDRHHDRHRRPGHAALRRVRAAGRGSSLGIVPLRHA